MATRIGLEPTTPSVTGWCSNQLSYRAMIAQVRAASYRGNVLYYIGKSVCCQAQICGKCNFLQKRAKTPSVCSLWSQPPSPRGRQPSQSSLRDASSPEGGALGIVGKLFIALDTLALRATAFALSVKACRLCQLSQRESQEHCQKLPHCT